MSETTNIKLLRKKMGLSQEELAKKLGVTQGAVSQWETVGGSPFAEKLPELAKILGCTIDELFQ